MKTTDQRNTVVHDGKDYEIRVRYDGDTIATSVTRVDYYGDPVNAHAASRH